MKLDQRFVQLFQKCRSFFGQFDVDHAAIFKTAIAFDEFLLFEPVDQSRHGGNDLNHSFGDFEGRHWLTFAPQDSQNVVLRGRQTESPKQPAEPILESIACPQCSDSPLPRAIRTAAFSSILLKFIPAPLQCSSLFLSQMHYISTNVMSTAHPGNPQRKRGRIHPRLTRPQAAIQITTNDQSPNEYPASLTLRVT